MGDFRKLSEKQRAELPAKNGIFYWDHIEQAWQRTPRAANAPLEAVRQITRLMLKQRKDNPEADPQVLILEVRDSDNRFARVVPITSETLVNYESSHCLRIFGSDVFYIDGSLDFIQPYVKIRLASHGDQKMEIHSLSYALPSMMNEARTIEEILSTTKLVGE